LDASTTLLDPLFSVFFRFLRTSHRGVAAVISHPSRHCTVELQALPSRIGQVRRIVSAQLRYWHLDPLIDRAALGVTELLSNVHRHARPDKSCTVELELLPDRLTVSVRDHDPRLPVVADDAEAADATPLATCGRGLAMVAAVSESWGARPDGDNGKVVWFTLPASAAARTQSARLPRRTAEPQQAPRISEGRPAPAPVAAAAPAPAPAHASALAPAAAVTPASPPAPVTASPPAPISAPAPAPVAASASASASTPAPARSAVPG
jgi:anti-sigma regulatory factor (Ser/Thr protein kinase)